MKTKLSSLIRLYSVIALVFVCAGVWGIGEVSAASSCNSEYCRVDPSDTLTVDQWSTCYEISNYPPNIAIYIPVRTAPEWVYFYNNLPSNVTKTSCPPPGNNTGAYTGTYTGSYTSGYTSTSGYTPPQSGYESGYTPPQSGYESGYTPPQSGYTPPQSGYESGYTPPQSGYTPPQSGYESGYTPPQSGYESGYTPPQSGYTAQSGYESGYTIESGYTPPQSGYTAQSGYSSEEENCVEVFSGYDASCEEGVCRYYDEYGGYEDSPNILECSGSLAGTTCSCTCTGADVIIYYDLVCN